MANKNQDSKKQNYFDECIEGIQKDIESIKQDIRLIVEKMMDSKRL
jgi:hypothetical protein